MAQGYWVGFVVEGGVYGFSLYPAVSGSLEKIWCPSNSPHESLCSGPSGAVIQKTEDPHRGPLQCLPTISLVDDNKQYSLGPLKSRALIVLTALNFQ